ncbi:MAG: histidine phosphatase family protein [Pseudomonadota bacterium]
MTIHLIRHGQSEFNALFDGSRDPMIFDAPLTPLGQEQAELTREKAARLGIAHVLCSPLTRAIQTAHLIFPDHTPTVLAETAERLGHSCDVGRPPSDLAARFPIMAFDHLAETWWHQGPLNENGIPVEPWSSFKTRMAELREGLLRYQDRPLAVVCHGHVIHALTGTHPRNCEILELRT